MKIAINSDSISNLTINQAFKMKILLAVSMNFITHKSFKVEHNHIHVLQ